MLNSSVRTRWLHEHSVLLLLGCPVPSGPHLDGDLPLLELAAAVNVSWSHGPAAGTVRLLEALPLLELDSEVRAHALLALSCFQLARLDLASAEDTAQRALDFCRTRPAARRTAPLLLGLLSLITLLQRRPVRALQYARQAQRRAGGEPVPAAFADLCCAEVLRLSGHWQSGQLSTSLELYQRAVHHSPTGEIQDQLTALRDHAYLLSGLPAASTRADQAVWRQASRQLLLTGAGYEAPSCPVVTLAEHGSAGADGFFLDGRWVAAGRHVAAMTVLRKLCSTGPIGAEWLGDHLWPDESSQRQGRLLRHQLHVLRELFQDSQVVRTRAARVTLSRDYHWPPTRQLETRPSDTGFSTG